MTPTHPRWEEFAERLSGPEGCNFHYMNPAKKEGLRWNCDTRSDRPKTRAILATMPGVDVQASLDYFKEHGGYCDCEILFNVEDSVLL